MIRIKGKELQKAMKSNNEIIADIKSKKEIDLKKALKNCLENMNVMNEILLAYFTHAKRPNLTPERKDIEVMEIAEPSEEIFEKTKAILATESDVKIIENTRTNSPALYRQIMGRNILGIKKSKNIFSRIFNLFKKNKK